jgi:DnaJ-class molecular chaperone
MADKSQTTTRRILNGSMTCQECRGRGEVFIGERHGCPEWDLCPVCRGNTTVPLWKEVQDA